VLNAYLSVVSGLLQLPGAPQTLYTNSNLTGYINLARGQVAAQSKCLRVLGTLATTPGQRFYTFQSINIGTPSATGVDNLLHVRSIQVGIGASGGYQWVTPRHYDYLEYYGINNANPVQSQPAMWAQYGQGGSAADYNPQQPTPVAGGSFALDPIPDINYTLLIDCVCFPIPLLTDITVEALPYPWTDAVPWYAAYYALSQSQMQARRQDAMAYYQEFMKYMKIARMASTSDLLSMNYEQSPDPITALALQPSGGQQQ
jgi:hypothetical protein